MINFAGVEFRNAFVVASGPASATVSQLKKAEEAGAAGASLKLAMSKVPFKTKLRVYTIPKWGTIHAMDRRLELDEGLELMERGKKETSLVLFANITSEGADLKGWGEMARAFEEVGADLIETNFCCPMVGLDKYQMGLKGRKTFTGGAMVGENPELCAEITRIIKRMTHIPLVCKLTPTASNLAEVAEACENAGADALAVFGGSALALPPVDIYDNGRPQYPLVEGACFGFYAGPMIRFASYKAVAQVAQKVRIPIVASGGIEKWRDGVEMIMWGATLISSCVPLMIRGFEIIPKINAGIEKFMAEQNYSSPLDFRGLALQHLRTSDEVKLIEGHAVVNPDKCNGCKLCLKPAHCEAITMADNIAVVSPEDCLGCSLCCDVCPSGAISMVQA